MSCIQHNKAFIIRNVKSRLVLDGTVSGTSAQVTIQTYSGSSLQLWKMECIDGGKFIITNVGTGYVLDINGGAAAGNKVITYSQKHGGPNQQWRIESDKTIVSGDTKFVVDIYESRFQAGTPVDVFTKWLTDNQLFELEYV
ncbi:hypothetical protein Zmor_002112 [Zophobas morio]|nr:hypothetical protein Zmor_002112 [Zophobas morio]